MPDASLLLTFLVAVLAMQAVPGPDTLLVISRGVGEGRRVALATAVGAVGAGIIQLPLLALGVAALVRSSPFAFTALRYAGAAYLAWLGLRLLLRGNRLCVPLNGLRSAEAAFREGMISNLMNPNVLVFMLAFLPQFVDPDGPIALQMILLGTIQKLCGLAVLGGTAFAAGTVGDWIARRPTLSFGRSVLRARS